MNYKYAAPHHGHRQRLREKFRLAGAEKMPSYEALELLLTFAVTRKDVKPIAKALLEKFGDLRGVMNASFDELRRFPDLGPASATLIKLVKDLCGIYLFEQAKEKSALTSPERVLRFAQMKLGGLPHEAFMVIFLNIQNEILHHDILNEGTVDQVAVYPRRIIEKALACHAAGVILAHNHPSGYTDPSEEDKRLTRVIREAGRLIDLKVVDHLIVGANGYFSFTEKGLC
jgi:DNA repair protein RadC